MINIYQENILIFFSELINDLLLEHFDILIRLRLFFMRGGVVDGEQMQEQK